VQDVMNKRKNDWNEADENWLE